MTKKDYVLIAENIKAYVSELDRRALANAMAIRLAEDNPRFDRDRFLEACGTPKSREEIENEI
jgi:hypothetical protein